MRTTALVRRLHRAPETEKSRMTGKIEEAVELDADEHRRQV
jgi:hypothetical protein